VWGVEKRGLIWHSEALRKCFTTKSKNPPENDVDEMTLKSLREKLHDAAAMADVQGCKRILSSPKANPCLKDKNGWNSLFWAIGEERGPEGKIY
jgi:hypothetical protein